MNRQQRRQKKQAEPKKAQYVKKVIAIRRLPHL